MCETHDGKAEDEGPEASHGVRLHRLPHAHFVLGILALEGLVHEVFVVQGILVLDAIVVGVGDVELLVVAEAVVLAFHRHGIVCAVSVESVRWWFVVKMRQSKLMRVVAGWRLKYCGAVWQNAERPRFSASQQ